MRIRRQRQHKIEQQNQQHELLNEIAALIQTPSFPLGSEGVQERNAVGKNT